MPATEAKQVTARLKLLLGTLAENTAKVLSLIELAEHGKAWQALGYPSWTAYVRTEFSGAVAGLARAERVPITAKLAEAGMPVRAIAAVTGTSVGTVHNDTVESGVQRLNTSTPDKPVAGLDGKSYLRNGRPTAGGMQELSDAVPPVRQKPRRRPLPDAYRDAVYDLDKVVRRLEKLHADDRFANNRKALAEQHPAVQLAELTCRINELWAELHNRAVIREGGGHQ